MTRMRKILIGIIITLALFSAVSTSYFYFNREKFFARALEAGRAALASNGLTLAYESRKFGFFPPEIALSGVALDNPADGGHFLLAKSIIVKVHPLNLLLPGLSSLSVDVVDFSITIDSSIISRFKVGGKEDSDGGKFLPDINLRKGHVELKDGVGNLEYAYVGVDLLSIHGKYFFGERIQFHGNREGVEGVVLFQEERYPFKFNAASVDLAISSKKVTVRGVTLNSPMGKIKMEGMYRFDGKDVGGLVAGNLDVKELLKFGRIHVPDGLLGGGKFSFSGRVGFKDGVFNLAVKSNLLDLIVKGQECSVFANCLIDRGRLSLKKLAVNTPAGRLEGDLWVDGKKFTGEGLFHISNFRPGELTKIIPPLAGFLLEGSGGGDIKVHSTGKGAVSFDSIITMERGLTLTLPAMNEKIQWEGPVKITGAAEAEGLINNPKIIISQLSVAKEGSSIDVSGEIDISKQQVDLTTRIDIKEVKSLGMHSLLGKSGTIKGEIGVRGNLLEPTLEVDSTIKEFSMRGIPPGTVLIKGAGLLGGNISLIADYLSTIGNVTFSGTYFPEKAVKFVGTLRAKDFKIDSFTSEEFLGSNLFSSLNETLPDALPLSGSIVFDGDLLAGGENITAKGRISSKEISSEGLDIRNIEGAVKYKNGEVELTRIAFQLLGGRVEVKGDIKKEYFSLSGKLNDIDPSVLNKAFKLGHETVRGSPLRGSFKVGMKGDDLVIFSFEGGSSQVSIGQASLTGVKVLGRKKKQKIILSLQTDNDALTMDAVVDSLNSSLSVKLGMKSIPIPLKGNEEDEDGEIGLIATGHVDVATLDLSNLKGDFPQILFSFETFNAEMDISPYFTENDLEGITYIISTNKKGDLIKGTIASKGGETFTYSVERKKSGKIYYRVKGRAWIGRFPVVVPSGLNGIVGATISLDLKGDLSSFPHGSEGFLKVLDLETTYPGEIIRGKNIEATMKGDIISIRKGELTANEESMNISGSIALDGSTDLSLIGNFDAGLVRAIVGGVFENIRGRVEGGIRVSGVYPSLVVVGKGKIVNTYIKFTGFKHSLNELSADMSFFRDRILFDSISGSMGGGPIDGSGEVHLVPDGPVLLSFNVDFFGVSFAYPEEYPSQLEGSAELAGAVNDLFLRGEIFVERAVYSRPIRIERLIDIGKKVDKFRGIPRVGFAIKLDLDITSEGSMRVNNNIAQLTAGGDFRVLGDTLHPVILGTFESIEGEAEYRGTEYVIERLVVDFDDPIDNTPRILGLASAEKGNYTVFVEAEGRLDELTIDLYSNPPLSKNDVVSLLSLGVTSGELNGGGSGSATANLAGVAVAPLTAKIEEQAGLTRFSVESNYSQSTGVVEPTLVVGKNVGSRISLDFSSSLSGSGSKNLVGEFKIFKDIYFRGDWASSGPSSEGEIGGEFRIKKYFHSLSEFLGSNIGGDRW